MGGPERLWNLQPWGYLKATRQCSEHLRAAKLEQISLELPNSLSHVVIIDFNTAHFRKNTRYAQQNLF